MKFNTTLNIIEEQYEIEKSQINFYYMDFFTIENKNLYRKCKKTNSFISKLKRHISSMVKYKECFYIIDTYGDIYKIINDSLNFISGGLCSVKDFIVWNDQIILLDKYGRIKYFDFFGKLIDVKFTNYIAAIDVKDNEITYIPYKIDCYGKELDLNNVKFKIIHAFNKTFIVLKDSVFLFCKEKNHKYLLIWNYVIYNKDGNINLFSENEEFICKIAKKDL